jgi:hypothetical protein
VEQSTRSNYAIEDIGEIRASNGTALSTVAGAAAYWEKEAKAIKKRVGKEWRDGFLTGSVSVAGVTLATIIFWRLFF